MKLLRRPTLCRRTVLRGLTGASSVALALPLLDIMLDGNGEALADGGELPRRFGVWFWGNGLQPGAWAPATTGPAWEPTGMLAGLAAVKDYINVISGGVLPVPGANNPHVEGAVGILSAGNPLLHESYAGQGDDWNFLTVPNPSVDEVAADHLTGGAPFRTLTTAVTPVHTSDAGSTNHPGTAISYISHPAPYVFNPPTMDPSELFGILFGKGIPRGIRHPPRASRARRCSMRSRPIPMRCWIVSAPPTSSGSISTSRGSSSCRTGSPRSSSRGRRAHCCPTRAIRTRSASGRGSSPSWSRWRSLAICRA